MAIGRKAADVKHQIKLAHELYKYQDFKSSVAATKVKSDVYQPSTIIAFHSLLRKYLHTGVKDLRRANNEFYNMVDELKSQCFSVLRPSEQDAARPFTQHEWQQKNSRVNTTKDETVKQINNKTSEKINICNDTLTKIKNTNTIVGVQVKDSIKLFENEDVMKGFISAFSYMDNPPEYKKVKVTITEI